MGFDSGYTRPFTETGSSELVVSPPWHFSGDCLVIDFFSSEMAVSRLLPRSVQGATGECLAAFINWQSRSEDPDERFAPERTQFTEFALLAHCTVDGATALFCLFAWVDRYFSIARGWIQGMPKKEGRIWVSRPVLAGSAGPRLAAGEIVAATASSSELRIASAALVLERPSDEIPAFARLPTVNHRVFPSWLPDQPRVDELVTSLVTEQELANTWEGSAQLDLFDSPWDEIGSLAPVSVKKGWWFAYGETLIGGLRAG